VRPLENRSFDHMLGRAGITGIDADTGQPTAIDGLTGTESNSFHGITDATTTDAVFRMAHDPAHSFAAQLIQLCRDHARRRPTYPPGGPCPRPIDDSGFATSYALGDHDPANVMRDVPSAITVVSRLPSRCETERPVEGVAR
jgi:phospholipase C